MKEQLERLIRLQEIDARIAEILRRQSQMPILIEEKKKGVDDSEARLSQIRATLDRMNAERRDKERELADRESRLSKLKDKQTEIKTNKEYQAFLTEVEAGKEEIGRIEEDLLQIMEGVDTTRQALSRSEQEHQEVAKSFSTYKSAIDAEAADLETDLSRLEKDRAALQEKIHSDLLKTYRQILSIRKDRAVAEIQNGICSGCHMNVPPQLIANVRKHDKVLTCSNCRRILYDASLAVKSA